MQEVSSFAVKADRVIDYIPGLSTVSGIVAIVLKIIFACTGYEPSSKDHYFKHIQEKSLAICILILIPVLGNLIVAMIHCSKVESEYEDPVTNYLPPLQKLKGYVELFKTLSKNPNEKLSLAPIGEPNSKLSGNDFAGTSQYLWNCCWELFDAYFDESELAGFEKVKRELIKLRSQQYTTIISSWKLSQKENVLKGYLVDKGYWEDGTPWPQILSNIERDSVGEEFKDYQRVEFDILKFHLNRYHSEIKSS